MYECKLYNNIIQRCARLSIKNLTKTHIKDICSDRGRTRGKYELHNIFIITLHCLHCDQFHRRLNRRSRQVVMNDSAQRHYAQSVCIIVLGPRDAINGLGTS